MINKALGYPLSYQVTLLNLLQIYLDITTNPIDEEIDQTITNGSLSLDHPFDIIYKSRASFTIYLLQLILLLCVDPIVFYLNSIPTCLRVTIVLFLSCTFIYCCCVWILLCLSLVYPNLLKSKDCVVFIMYLHIRYYMQSSF